MSSLEVIILAGGFGTRLQSVVKDVPKPMADINGTPFLSFIMDYLIGQNVNKVLLSVGYKYEAIMTYFGSKYKNIDIQYIIEDKPIGTGGAIKKACQCTEGDDVIVLNGDTFFCLDLNKMLRFHYEQGADITIAIKPMKNVERYNTLILDKNKVIEFQDKMFREFGYINGGVYIISKKIFEPFQEGKEFFSFEIDFLKKKCLCLNFFAFISNSYFIDIGIPEDYKKAVKELKRIITD